MGGERRDPLQQTPVAIRERRITILTRDVKQTQTAPALGYLKL
jgi:hypothetical protein